MTEQNTQNADRLPGDEPNTTAQAQPQPQPQEPDTLVASVNRLNQSVQELIGAIEMQTFSSLAGLAVDKDGMYQPTIHIGVYKRINQAYMVAVPAEEG